MAIPPPPKIYSYNAIIVGGKRDGEETTICHLKPLTVGSIVQDSINGDCVVESIEKETGFLIIRMTEQD
jgi:hypothetical protein